jgi:transcription elongation factor S-II
MSFLNQNDKRRQFVVDKLDYYIKDESISRNIEKSIYNYTIKLSVELNITRSWENIIFLKLYLSKVRSIYSNIKPDSYIKNTDFLKRILNGDINIEKISQLTRMEIYPDNWKELIDKKVKIDTLKSKLKPEAMTDQFKCRKCGSRSTSYYEVQTRSADEPMTQFITCLDCGNHWKQ